MPDFLTPTCPTPVIYFNLRGIPGPSRGVFFRIMQNKPSRPILLTQEILAALAGS